MGKGAFISPVIAWRYLRSRSDRVPRDVLPYRCQYCGRWHVGGSRQTIRREGRK